SLLPIRLYPNSTLVWRLRFSVRVRQLPPLRKDFERRIQLGATGASSGWQRAATSRNRAVNYHARSKRGAGSEEAEQQGKSQDEKHGAKSYGQHEQSADRDAVPHRQMICTHADASQ